MTSAGSIALRQVHLSAGQLLISREPQIVITVLGSCVAVTMFDPGSKLAAICHAMLPHPRPSEGLQPDDPGRYRFVAHAVPAMLAAYRRAGVNRSSITVKIFGGGNVIGHSTPEFANGRVGSGNVETARDLLTGANLVVSAENTGGHCGRKILFNTETGEVLHKKLHRTAP